MGDLVVQATAPASLVAATTKGRSANRLHLRRARYVAHHHHRLSSRRAATASFKAYRAAKARRPQGRRLAPQVAVFAPPPSCGAEGEPACGTAMEAEDALVLANRAAIARGVPAPLLRVGLDQWMARQATAASARDRLRVDEDRLAFVDQAVATHANWRAAYIARQGRMRLASQSAEAVTV